MTEGKKKKNKSGPLKIPLDFEEALKDILQVKPEKKEKKKEDKK